MRVFWTQSFRRKSCFKDLTFQCQIQNFYTIHIEIFIPIIPVTNGASSIISHLKLNPSISKPRLFSLHVRRTLVSFQFSFLNILQLNTQLLRSGFLQLGAGLSVGFGGLAAGYSVGIVGDYVSNPLFLLTPPLLFPLSHVSHPPILKCVRAYGQESRLFVSMILILIFAEVLGLYGLIVALILNTKANNGMCEGF